MERQIFVAIQGQSQGPYTTAQVQQMLAAGRIASNDLAWTAGMQSWAPLSTLLPPALDNASPLNIPEIPEYHPRPMPSGYATTQNQGIGGWLLVYCILSIFFAPLFAFGSMYSNWQSSTQAFEEFPALRSGVILENIGIGVIAVATVLIGIALWVRIQNARRIVKVYLVVRLIFFFVLEGIVVAYIAASTPQITAFLVGAAIGGLLREVVYFGIWFSYFVRSVRVQNTYGD